MRTADTRERSAKIIRVDWEGKSCRKQRIIKLSS